MFLSRGAYEIPLRLSLRESVQNYIRGCKEFGGRMHVRAQRSTLNKPHKGFLN